MSSSRSISFQLSIAYGLITIIAASYMTPWVAIGTFIEYYMAKYGCNYFVWLNTAFYLPGLPISFMQLSNDELWDRKYGIKNTFLCRMTLALIVCAGVMFSFPFCERNQILILTTLLGVFAWSGHGTLTPMASLFPKKAVGFLQFGFQVPNAFALGLCLRLGLYNVNTNEVMEVYTDEKVIRFYFHAGAFAILGLMCTVALRGMNITKDLQDKYNKNLMDLSTVGGSSFGEDDQTTDTTDDENNDDGRLLLSTGTTAGVRWGGEENGNGEGEDYISQHSAPLLPSSPSKSSKFRHSDSSKIQAWVLESIRLHRYVLFFTIFASIFSGSFFSKVKTADPDNATGLGQLLYFTRLFSDLAGRIFTFLPRPKIVKSINGLFVIMLLRMGLLVIFFLYILDLTPKNDTFIIILVGVCALQSGFNAVLVYEYVGIKVVAQAGAIGSSSDCNCAKSIATKALNMSFQYACFAACLCNILGVCLL
ncbi:hypothetical protein TrLO_g3311 [Triparma laevis f. longispina]|uniref:Uncharacterized protein n=2 Tax=Triparma laevis TaxID=1534972 RepID=A0A9W7KVY9_9STRA|nr:hypothetical protein TrLO_g3311 [Triparma laevis f. longispina]